MAERPRGKGEQLDPLERISACFKEFSAKERYGTFHKDMQTKSADLLGEYQPKFDFSKEDVDLILNSSSQPPLRNLKDKSKNQPQVDFSKEDVDEILNSSSQSPLRYLRDKDQPQVDFSKEDVDEILNSSSQSPLRYLRDKDQPQVDFSKEDVDEILNSSSQSPLRYLRDKDQPQVYFSKEDVDEILNSSSQSPLRYLRDKGENVDCYKRYGIPDPHPSLFGDYKISDIDEQANVDYFEYVDIQKIDFTKRPPPSLFEEDRISDSAKDTCNTMVGGFVMTVSQNILFDGYLDMESYGTTKNSSKIQLDITRNKNIWFENRNTEMFDRISKIETLLTAIKQKDHDEVMRIYYRSQHIHTFDDNSVPMKVEICVEKDRLHINWHEHIQTAINKISIAAPGIQFIHTGSKEPLNESTNYIKIGIDNPISKGKAYTCFRNGYPLIHLGEEWPDNSKAGTSIHEILHALGFGHIMKRFDSNLYLNVKKDGLDCNSAYQYTSNPSYGMLTRFDPFSIMMYPENDYMKRKEGDKIWDLKKGPEQLQEMSELDKVALNLMYKPCKSNSEYPYSPVLSESTNMLYCGRDVMKSHNQNVPPTISSKCGPKIWANCSSCRVFKDLKTQTGKKIQILGIQRCLDQHKWQGLSGNFYCGVKFAPEFHTCRFGISILSDGVCGPDQGIPCTDCGKQLKPDYSYTDFNPTPVNRMTDNPTT